MSNISTAVVTCCNENSLIFRVETELRAGALREPDFSRAIHLANCALLAQKDRFAHEEACPVCRAAEAIN